MVAALVAATGLQPRVAGKPARPLLDAAIRLVRLQEPAGRRGSAGHRHRLRGRGRIAESAGLHRRVSTAADLLAAVPEQRPTYLAFDLRGLVEEDHAVRIPAASSSGSSLEWSVTVDAGSAGAGVDRGRRAGTMPCPTAARCARWPC